MRVLVWQWGRFGGPPRFAALLAEGLTDVPDVTVGLSLSDSAEILRGDAPPRCDLPMRTYNGLAGFLVRALTAPFSLPGLIRRVRSLRPDLVVCAQPGPLDLLMAAALRWLRIPFVVIVHDADAHPGDGFPLQIWLQQMLCRSATAVAALSSHVGDRLREQGLAGIPKRPLILLHHPLVRYTFSPGLKREPGTFRLLSFGRLLPYKGLDLLVEALTILGPRPGLEVRVVGSGPESTVLTALAALPGVVVENRWVAEDEIGGVFGWADAVILPYREASQSGVAAVALAANRPVVATNVGGLAEQLANEPLAILCSPDAASLADGIRRVLDAPPVPGPRPASDAAAGWRETGQILVDRMGSRMAVIDVG